MNLDFFFLFEKKWVSRAMGNETFYWDGLNDIVLASSPNFISKGYNRPFYRCGGHIELIRFKEYYRMPRGHEHILFVFLSAFWDIFS